MFEAAGGYYVAGGLVSKGEGKEEGRPTEYVRRIGARCGGRPPFVFWLLLRGGVGALLRCEESVMIGEEWMDRKMSYLQFGSFTSWAIQKS